ncbi:MAG TPA: hypothetical protein VFS08_08310, partial [Gemmatimonadaceae bacterium]|nr:hypothetical protein [Gemmatimonadaceae bacterium]
MSAGAFSVVDDDASGEADDRDAGLQARPGTDVVVVPLHVRALERAERLQMLLELPPAAALLLEALHRMRASGASAGDHLLAAAELATSAALLVLTARELRGRRHRPSTRSVAAADLAAGGMLTAEWADAVAHGGKYVSPTLLSAAVAFTLALLPLWIPDWRTRRRTLRLDEQGLRYRASLRRRVRAEWRELTAVARRGERVELHRHDGRPRVIDLRALANGDA